LRDLILFVIWGFYRRHEHGNSVQVDLEIGLTSNAASINTEEIRTEIRAALAMVIHDGFISDIVVNKNFLEVSRISLGNLSYIPF
jgi:hypothetical protein